MFLQWQLKHRDTTADHAPLWSPWKRLSKPPQMTDPFTQTHADVCRRTRTFSCSRTADGRGSVETGSFLTRSFLSRPLDLVHNPPPTTTCPPPEGRRSPSWRWKSSKLPVPGRGASYSPGRTPRDTRWPRVPRTRSTPRVQPWGGPDDCLNSSHKQTEVRKQTETYVFSSRCKEQMWIFYYDREPCVLST